LTAAGEIRGADVLAKLDEVRRLRLAFRPLTRRLVARALERVETPEGPWVEVGAGDGQLRDLLPEVLVDRVVHTEPLAEGLRRLRAAHPEAVAGRATAEALPIRDGAVSCVLAACLFDMAEDLPSIVRECSRVLSPGGAVVHLLDMAADVRPVLRDVRAAGLVALPNVFEDPCADSWPRDMFLIEQDQLSRLKRLLREAGLRLPPALERYLSLYRGLAFRTAEVAAAYDAFAEDGQAKLYLREVLRSAGRQIPGAEEFRGHPVSTARHCAARLVSCFEAGGFRTEICDVLADRQLGSRGELTYLSNAVGHVRKLGQAPVHLLCGPAPSITSEATLLEQSLLLLVMRRS
jgi:SAM-dependent methyltransferase